MTAYTEPGRCPVANDLLAPEVIEDPYSYFRRLREFDPVHWNSDWDAWLVTSYEAVSEVLRQPNVFASDRATFYRGLLPPVRKDFYDIVFHVYPRWLAGNDPPQHDHMRRIVNTNWTPSKVQNLRAQIRKMVEDLLDTLPRNEPIDLIDRFATPLPAAVISSVIGIPSEHWPMIKRWSDDWGELHFGPTKDAKQWDKSAGALGEFHAYVAARLQECKAAQGNDYFTKMLGAQFEGNRLKDDEIVVHIIEQLFAGHETTTNLIGNGLVLLLKNRDQWKRLCETPSLAASTFEEVMRYEGPVKMITRWAKEDCELNGKSIRKGQNLLLILAAANRDPARFANPEAFDIARSPNPHLTFGQGIHFCLGAPLARLEGEEAFRALAMKFPRLTLAGTELTHRAILRARALDKLPVQLN